MPGGTGRWFLFVFPRAAPGRASRCYARKLANWQGITRLCPFPGIGRPWPALVSLDSRGWVRHQSALQERKEDATPSTIL
jgi:hypothetical protein